MRAVGSQGGVERLPSPLPRGPRTRVFAALALLLGSLFAAQPLTAQVGGVSWSFEDDAFADLWFHGLATVGFYGFGPTPLYDPGYAEASKAARATAGGGPTTLHREAGSLLTSLQGSEAFEVLHFVPLYFRGATREDALQALRAVAALAQGVPPLDASVRTGGAVVASLLASTQERRVLAVYLDALDEEWQAVVAPRRRDGATARSRALTDIESRWSQAWAPALAGFLDREGRSVGTVILTPALGAEGRFLESDPTSPSRALVAVGVPAGTGGADAALSSLVRELCYPAVRRAFLPFEARVPDRMDASRASDLAATRCGELLLEARVPEHVTAYRSRFALPSGGLGRGFLSTSGRVPGAAAWEGQLDTALRRELHLDLDEARANARPVRRN